MIHFPLDLQTTIEVPSLGFGPKWRRARALLAALTEARLRGFDPLTPWEKVLAGIGLWRGVDAQLKKENKLWRALFTECQGHAGYTRRQCARLLDDSVTYAHRHDYEQILLYGAAPLDCRGLKKNSDRVPKVKKSAPSSASNSNGFASSSTASSRKASLPKPTAASSAPETKPAFVRSSTFWIRRSQSPTPLPHCKCSPSTNEPK